MQQEFLLYTLGYVLFPCLLPVEVKQQDYFCLPE